MRKNKKNPIIKKFEFWEHCHQESQFSTRNHNFLDLVGIVKTPWEGSS